MKCNENEKDIKFLDKFKDRLDDEWSEVVDVVEERREAIELLKRCNAITAINAVVGPCLQSEVDAFLERVK